jgi:hypothetical protein
MNMELFDRYLKCVGAMLPPAHKTDILEELSDDIHSQAEEKEAQLGRPLQLGEQSDILRATGHPLRVAMRYRNIGQHQLISPLLYPAYIFALKVMLLIVGVAHVITALVLLAGGAGSEQVVHRFLELPMALIPVFAWITIVFAAFDYLQTKFHLLEIWDTRWNPMDLPVISADRPQPRPLNILFHMLNGIVFLTYLLVAKHVPYMFFGPAAAYLDPGPSWHKIYVPLVLYVTVGVVLQGVALARPMWRWFSAGSEIALNLVGIALLRLAIKLPAYFVVPHGVETIQKYRQMADIVNQSIYWSFFGISIGLAIATAIDGWKLFMQIRSDNRRQPGEPVSKTIRSF